MRRDRPQASRSRHCRAGRPILSPLIPGCSVAGDQGTSRFPVRGPMPRRCPECKLAVPGQGPSVPRSRGRRILAADGCASSLSNPACCFCAVWGPVGAEGVAVAMFGLSLVGHAHLPKIVRGRPRIVMPRPIAMHAPCDQLRRVLQLYSFPEKEITRNSEYERLPGPHLQHRGRHRYPFCCSGPCE